MDFWSATLMLLFIMDPLGNIPMFHSVLIEVPEPSRRKVMIRELLIAFVVLVGCLIAGKPILSALGLQQSTLSIAGGLMLLLIALHMVFPQHGLKTDVESKDPFIVPLAVPLIAGPSAIATLLLLASREPGRMSEWALALVLAWSVTAAVLLSSHRLMRVIGQRGLRACEKLMGMLLILMSVQMFLDGVKGYWKSELIR
ncbi:MAG: NAAT family transporter [Pedosphaera sp.]|nr:NAAT family transporter [Pedosphaera sp.]